VELTTETGPTGDTRYPAFAWPGGYPLVYRTADGGALCPECVNGRHGSEAGDRNPDPQWRLTGCDVHWEGEPITCDHCGARVESAYGVPGGE
jgi:hypothetical protein